jgi:hypothetical protein
MVPTHSTSLRHAAAYSLCRALHRYASWINSLKSAGPCSLAAADQYIREILGLRDQHFRRLARQIDDLVLGHQRLREALGPSVVYTNCQTSGEVNHFPASESQVLLINRLLSLAAKYLATSPALSGGVLIRTNAITKLPAKAQPVTATHILGDGRAAP